jgi:hypothetical protein
MTLIVIATISWTLLCGKDLNWDQLNYHFYVGFAWLHDRFGHDFMAANGQSYLNPLAYVPFAWMVNHDWHSLLIGSLLAAFHSLNIVLAYLICRSVLQGHPQIVRAVAGLGALLAFLSPIFLMEAGTTFADITTSVLLLAGVLLLLQTGNTHRWWSDRALLAGLAVGIAASLKTSNLVFLPAFGAMVLCLQVSVRGSIRGLLLLGTGAATGFIATLACWVLPLSSGLGEPLPEASDAFLPQRFLPENFVDAVVLPFRMAQLRSWIYIESVAPDLRFATAIPALATLCAVWLVRRKSVSDTTHLRDQRLASLMTFFLVATGFWIATSSNGRYGIVVSILCGPLLAVLAYALLPRKSLAIGALIALACLQILHLQNAKLRWGGGNWTASWYEISIPNGLLDDPSLYVSVGNNSSSYIAPFLSAESAFVNPIGQISIDLDGPGGAHLRALFSKYAGRVRILTQASSDYSDDSLAWTGSANAMLSRLGFAVNTDDCVMISTGGPGWEPGLDFNIVKVEYTNYLRTCGLKSAEFPEAQQRARIASVAQLITSWCPRLFRSNYSVVEHTPNGWFVNYVSTDTTLRIQEDRIVLTQPQTSADLDLGTLEGWEHGIKPDCSAIPTRLRKRYSFE